MHILAVLMTFSPGQVVSFDLYYSCNLEKLREVKQHFAYLERYVHTAHSVHSCVFTVQRFIPFCTSGRGLSVAITFGLRGTAISALFSAGSVPLQRLCLCTYKDCCICLVCCGHIGRPGPLRGQDLAWDGVNKMQLNRCCTICRSVPCVVTRLMMADDLICYQVNLFCLIPQCVSFLFKYIITAGIQKLWCHFSVLCVSAVSIKLN